ncbi:hypothetical protein VHE8714_02523 [Vibrio splendidus]|nr:hypothetical protein VHE8714_02523 [Vibrio splendidus]
MNFVHLIVILFFLFFGNSTMAITSNDYIVVSQPDLENSLACERVEETRSICLASILWHPSPEAYVIKFKVNRTTDSKDIEIITTESARLMSVYLNPLTANFYETKPALVDMLDVTELHAENIIVEIEFDNNGSYYSAYFYPKLTNGNLSLIHDFFEGRVDIYKHLLDVCKKMSRAQKDHVFQEYCVFTNVP